MPSMQRYALLSVSDKTKIIEFAQDLQSLGYAIIATGGTAALLKSNHLSVIEVADYTGFPEILDGRVKTLHPKIFAGILGREQQDDATLQQHAIPYIDIVAVNLYPFQSVVGNPDASRDDAIEQIDIGGPSLLRAAAKNHARVNVVVDPTDYSSIIASLRQDGKTSLATRQQLAVKVFSHTSQYDAMIARYFDSQPADAIASQISLNLHRHYLLRYGENPQQQAALYQSQQANLSPGVGNATLLQGKPLSYNNYLDADAAYRCIAALDSNSPGCAIIKHATPCGIAQAEQLLEAYQAAYRTDPLSAFGGIIACNRPIDGKTTKQILQQQFVELIVAPAFEDEALQQLAQKPNCRLLQCPIEAEQPNNLNIRSIGGGILIQQADPMTTTLNDLTVVSDKQPSDQQLQDLLFSWRVVANVKSNAIVYAKDRATLGIGGGQPSRVFSAKIAIEKAAEHNLSLVDAVMASDAFIPFPDTIEVAKNAGIAAIIQPGGSKRDPEVIQAVNEAGLVMVFTGRRHFRH